MAIKYIYNNIDGIEFRYGSRKFLFDIELIKNCIEEANKITAQIQSLPINVASLLGMRNLSAFVGEVFVEASAIAGKGIFVKNPHQDGYPDLLVMDEEGRKLWESLKNSLHDKKPFSPFMTGGIEVKATCGSTPSPMILEKRGQIKPSIGDTRISLITGYDWKAHHRETNNLIGIFWDFIDGAPTIVGVFYSSDLSQDDWGKIIHPKENGGRTTSVSIMTRLGVKKMYEGWIAVINDPAYIDFFNRYNKSNLIPAEQAS